MIDARMIGSYISSLRKEADLTQVELADQLSVSHQAVSKWERGDSIPDIGSLLDLSKIFGKSVDQLLNGSNHPRGKSGSLLTHISENRENQAAEMINQEEADVDGLVDVAPLLKASELRKVTGSLNKERFTFQHVVELAPFLDEETLDNLARNVEIPELDFEEVTHLAPFLYENTLMAFLDKVKGTPDFKEVIRLAPFLGEHIEPFIEKTEITKLDWEGIRALAPFVRSKTLIRLIDEAVNEPPNIQQMIQIAPFLEEEIDQYLEKTDVEKVQWKEIIRLAPFVEAKTLARLVENVEAPNARQLVEIAPFLDSDQLSDFFKQVGKDQLTPDLLSSIAPFVSREDLSQLMAQLLEKEEK